MDTLKVRCCPDCASSTRCRRRRRPCTTFTICSAAASPRYVGGCGVVCVLGEGADGEYECDCQVIYVPRLSLCSWIAAGASRSLDGSSPTTALTRKALTHWVCSDRGPAAMQAIPIQVATPACSNSGSRTETLWPPDPLWCDIFHPRHITLALCIQYPVLYPSHAWLARLPTPPAPEQPEARWGQFRALGSHEDQGLPNAPGRHAARSVGTRAAAPEPAM